MIKEIQLINSKIIKLLSLPLLVLIFFSSQAQSGSSSVVRGLSWDISKTKAQEILKSRYGLTPDFDKGEYWKGIYPDAGELLVYITSMDAVDFDLILTFIDDKLFQIEYFKATRSFQTLHHSYTVFYNSLTEKYKKPTFFEESVYSKEIALKFFKEAGLGSINHLWEPKSLTILLKFTQIPRTDGKDYHLSVQYTSDKKIENDKY